MPYKDPNRRKQASAEQWRRFHARSPDLWTCRACGWRCVGYAQKCDLCKTKRGKIRNVAWIEEATQYELLDRNRNHRTGCPGKRGGNGIVANVQTDNDGVAWG